MAKKSKNSEVDVKQKEKDWDENQYNWAEIRKIEVGVEQK